MGRAILRSEPFNQPAPEVIGTPWSRRDFIKRTTAALVGVTIMGCDPREKTPKVEPFNIVPDHERTLAEVLFALQEDHYIGNLINILSVIPSYTKVKLVARSDVIDRVRHLCQTAGIMNHIEGFPLQLGDSGDPWAQDWGEAGTYRGEQAMLISPDLDNTQSQDPTQSQYRRQRIHDIYGANAIDADFYFEGGNVVFDGDTSGGIRILTGNDTILKTMDWESRRGRQVQGNEVVSRIQRMFNAKDVLVLGPRTSDSHLLPQARHGFHIDLSFLLLQGKRAIYTQVDHIQFPRGVLSRGKFDYVQLSQQDVDQFVDQQSRTVSDLRSAGYTTIPIHHDYFSLMGFLMSVNAVPYIDANTGKNTALYPVFGGLYESPEEYDLSVPEEKRLTYRDLRDKGKMMFELLSDLGYTPVPIRSDTVMSQGAVHCSGNFLSQIRGDRVPPLQKENHQVEWPA